MPTLLDIRNKVRRVTGKLSDNEITDNQIDTYINNYYQYDFPEELRLQNTKFTYQFVTNAGYGVYDFPTDLYLENMPPVYVGGYQIYMTQSRESFYRVTPQLSFVEQNVDVGTNATGPYQFMLNNAPICRGSKPNPPGAYSSSTFKDIAAPFLNWRVLIYGTDANGNNVSLVDDGGGSTAGGFGLLFDPKVNVNTNLPIDQSTDVGVARGVINYTTGQVDIGVGALLGFSTPIANGASINAQYVPYTASRPQSVCFYQDQFMLWPIPDRAYTISFETYKKPTAMVNDGDSPQLSEWWQALAYGASDRIFADNGDIENLQKFRPLLDEQLKLIQRRTIVQQTSERTATIYTQQSSLQAYPFGSYFGGI